MKGYVVRWDDARGQALYAIRDSTSTVREDATVFATIREAVVEAGDGFVTARIFAVAEDGTETPLPTYEEALAQLDAVRAALAVLQRPDTLSSKDMAAGEHATAVEACKVAVGLVDSPKCDALSAQGAARVVEACGVEGGAKVKPYWVSDDGAITVFCDTAIGRLGAITPERAAEPVGPLFSR